MMKADQKIYAVCQLLISIAEMVLFIIKLFSILLNLLRKPCIECFLPIAFAVAANKTWLYTD